MLSELQYNRQLLSFCFPQKENIRQKFVADLQKEFAGKGLTFSIGIVYSNAFQALLSVCQEVAVGQ